MDLTALNAISPIDGRYRTRTAELAQWFSEHALMRYRLLVELSYFEFLCGIPLPELKNAELKKLAPLRARIEALTALDTERIKTIESTTNHDVKAVEYWLKEQLEELGFGEQKEFTHFALTSQDINNTALPLLLQDYVAKNYRPLLTELIEGRTPLRYLGRPRSSSPAEGSLAAHNYNQAALIEQAFSQEISEAAGIVIK